MDPTSINVINRQTGDLFQEKVFGGRALQLLYKNNLFAPLMHLISRNALLSSFYGWYQKMPWTKRKVVKFVRDYAVDASEFLLPISCFKSFNDFFIRKLKPEARPIATQEAVIPADGRYYFYSNISTQDFIVKGHIFNVKDFLKNESLAKKYEGGSLALARLCPVDYHRFHFPIDCKPSAPCLINGYLYSVNPIAVKQNVNIFCQNKRVMTTLNSKEFGDVLFVEIGATNVGSIHQTYSTDKECKKGEEKGYFSFGGSALAILFPPNRVQFDEDLTQATEKGNEILCQMGQSMGTCTSPQR